MKKFITPVSMKVTLEQYERDLEQPLKDLGYVWGSHTNTPYQDFHEGYPFLTTNYSHNNNHVAGHYDTLGYFIHTYNPQLFLALAAMTEGEEIKEGDYVVFLYDNAPEHLRTIRWNDSMGVLKVHRIIRDSVEVRNGASSNNIKYFRKATKEELINHFSDNSGEIKNNTNNNKMKTLKFPFELQKQDAQRIINIACNTWKPKLSKNWAPLLYKDSITIHEDEYDTMRAACTDAQNKLFDEIFGKVSVNDTPFKDSIKKGGNDNLDNLLQVKGDIQILNNKTFRGYEGLGFYIRGDYEVVIDEMSALGDKGTAVIIRKK